MEPTGWRPGDRVRRKSSSRRAHDLKDAPAVEVPTPAAQRVEGCANTHLLTELSWYLERFLDYPFPPETDHAEHVQAALKAWGTAKRLWSRRQRFTSTMSAALSEAFSPSWMRLNRALVTLHLLGAKPVGSATPQRRSNFVLPDPKNVSQYAVA